MQKVMDFQPTRKSPVAYYATLDGLVSGLALRDHQDRVFFVADATGLWTRLCDHDVPRLVLHGHTATALAQALVDGDLVRKCSRTLEVA
jgi:hypothetical protein